MAEQKLTEQESLELITQMIQKAKPGFHASGASAILWGSVVAIAGLVTYVRMEWDFTMPFDIWLIVLAAIIPHIFISIRERRTKRVTNHQEDMINGIWIAYGIGIFALVFYFHVVPDASERLIAGDHTEMLVKDLTTGAVKHLHPYVLSWGSLLLLL
ncbi:MAG: hypothetical protein JST39_11935, partial [Bacteroidetes bacterium]|nr:hypothetical protein [Bacteroidota bacterium]